MYRTLLVPLQLTLLAVASAQAPRVAIIGGGLGGTSAAYFLRQANPTWHLELFERDRIGGRTEELQYAGRTLELGASIIHGQNKYVLDLAKAMNLTAVQGDDTDSSFSIYDGSKFVFKQSGSQILDTLAVVGRYGISPLRYKWLSEEMARRFTGIYNLQEQQQGYATPQMLLEAVGLYELTQQDAASYMEDHLNRGVLRYGAQRFINELAGAVNRINYNQRNVILNAMAGLVSYLPAAQPDVYYIQEGNSALPEKLAAAAGLQAVHVGTAVQAVTLRSDGRFEIQAVAAAGRDRGSSSAAAADKDSSSAAAAAAAGVSKDTGDATMESAPQQQQQQQQLDLQSYGPFDAVILCTPLEGSGIELQGLPEQPIGLGNRTYQTTVTTYVVGTALNPAYFLGGDSPSGDVFVTNSADTPFTVIASKGSVTADNQPVAAEATSHTAAAADPPADLPDQDDSSSSSSSGRSSSTCDNDQHMPRGPETQQQQQQQRQLWKVFSEEPLSDNLISRLFTNGSVVASRPWKAYPRFHPPEGFAPFVLAPGLCYVNALENAASALEVAAVAAKNCALLIQKQLLSAGSLSQRPVIVS